MTAQKPIRELLLFGMLALNATIVASQTLATPTSPDPVINAYLKEAAADYAMVHANVNAAFATPAKTSPLPCEVPRLNLLKMVGAVDLTDEAPEIQRAYKRRMRRLGPAYIKSDYRTDNLQVLAIHAQCKSGKLDGDIELWATGTRIEDAGQFVMTQKFQKRVSFKAVGGVPVGRIRTLVRGGNENTWRDPEMVQLMKANPGPKLSDAWVLLYNELDRAAPAVNFAFVALTDPAVTSEIINVFKPLPNGGHEIAVYEHQQLKSTTQYKNGETHGQMVIYPAKDGFVAEKIVQCFRNGELYLANPCDVD